VLPEEVQSQLRAQARDLAEATDRFGRTVDLALRLAIYLAIAVFVIAMYLPIFTLGSTV
jgi:type II secretory pathway component PulF